MGDRCTFAYSFSTEFVFSYTFSAERSTTYNTNSN